MIKNKQMLLFLKYFLFYLHSKNYESLRNEITIIVNNYDETRINIKYVHKLLCSSQTLSNEPGKFRYSKDSFKNKSSTS